MTTYAWLIERRVTPPQWSTSNRPTGVGAFYSDPHRAHRFATKVEAENAMRGMCITPEERGEYFVCEHGWDDPMTHSTSLEQIAARKGERTRHAALTQREPIFAPVTTFEAWRASGHPIDLSGALSLAEAEIKAAMRVGHKGCFDILETNHAKAVKTLHTYTVRQGKREWRRDRGDGQPGYFAPLYPDKLMSRAVETYVPVRPFDAFQDCPVGVDRTLVEQKS